MRTRFPMCRLLLGLGLASCAIGAPPGFSPGTSWTTPLVDPLADGRLVTPVYVNGEGPFLFAIDPDATITTADMSIAAIAQIPAHSGERLTDEHDTTHPIWYAQLPNLKIGTLDVSLMRVALVENHQFDADGRRIWGVLGRDVIADSLVFTLDRDRGVARLTTQETFTPPANAQILPYKKLVSRTGSSSTRYLVAADIDGEHADLHLDLGELPSQLAPRHWDAAKLQSLDWNMTLIDEVGTHREVSTDGTAARVTVKGDAGPITRVHEHRAIGRRPGLRGLHGRGVDGRDHPRELLVPGRAGAHAIADLEREAPRGELRADLRGRLEVLVRRAAVEDDGVLVGHARGERLRIADRRAEHGERGLRAGVDVLRDRARHDPGGPRLRLGLGVDRRRRIPHEGQPVDRARERGIPRLSGLERPVVGDDKGGRRDVGLALERAPHDGRDLLGRRHSGGVVSRIGAGGGDGEQDGAQRDEHTHAPDDRTAA